MTDDLLVMLSHNSYAEAVLKLEDRVREAVACRHEYPIWPVHGDGPVDAYEESFHGPMRHTHYRATIMMIQTLRALRTLA
jgi:hypothetical protein